jgi:hypothetical protein
MKPLCLFASWTHLLLRLLIPSLFMASSTKLAQSTPLVAEGAMAGDAANATTSRFVPYHSPHHQPAKGRYITSNDPRGYM